MLFNILFSCHLFIDIILYLMILLHVKMANVYGGNYTLGHIYTVNIEQVTITFNNVDMEHVTIK